MVSIIHHPHDKLFRLSMEEPRVAQEFLSAHLPDNLLKMINLRLLKLENHSFIDEAYKETEADIVFSVPLEKTTAYIYLLLEHQSEIDPLIAFRLLIYRVRLMERHLKQYPEQPLPLIYPCVVYNGDQPWDAPVDLFTLFGEHGQLAKEWLVSPARLLDVRSLPDEDLSRRQWSGLMEFALKHRKIIDFKGFLDKFLPWVHTIERTDAAGFSLGKIVIKYVLNGTDAKGRDLFLEKMRQYLSPQLGAEIMTIAQEFEQHGQQKGLRLGIHQGEATMMMRQLTRRFKQVPKSYLQLIEQADAETLLVWGERILEAETLEDIFKDES
jgi:predicted transposase/invertase (TIGR01784 family)